MRYLITGGAGFIGSHLTDALLDRGHDVLVLDNLSTGRLRNVEHRLDHPSFQFCRGSVLDEAAVRKAVDQSDVVVHLAASVGVQLICQQPLESLINNVRGTEHVLQACAELGRKVLVASTSEIYGKNSKGPLREDADRILGSPFKARWAYSTSKAVDEILAYAYWRDRGTESIVVRLFNTIGPRQTGAYGMVVPRFVREALVGAPITVFGSGEQTRCFCHVLDTVAAILGLLDHPGAVGDVFNIGSQHEICIDDLARLVIHLVGSPSRVEHIPYDVAYEEGFEDMQRRVPDTTKIRSLTGWEPRRSLEETVEEVIAYQQAEVQEQST